MYPTNRVHVSPEERVMLVLAGYPEPWQCTRIRDDNTRCPCIGRARPSAASDGGMCVCCLSDGHRYYSPLKPYVYNCDGTVADAK